MSTIIEPSLKVPETFPAFSLPRLLRTVFHPKPGERTAILIDLQDPSQVMGFAFLKDPDLTIQRHAYEVFTEACRMGCSAS